MRMFKIIIITLCFSCFNISCAQKLSEIDMTSRQNAESIINTYFSDKVENSSYVVFSIADKDFVVVIEKEKAYKEYYIRKDSTEKNIQIKDTIYNKSNALFKKMFNKELYHKEFITFTSDFFKPEYELAKGNSTYFVLKNEEKRYGEVRLTVFVQPNPIDFEVYNYLVHRTIHYLNN